ncbi:MAG TPA: AraC family transcriptional regulator [Polyangiaceae bacterium]|nr:AraC family transcriptional regulator [Polyangiaceae bacterium]
MNARTALASLAHPVLLAARQANVRLDDLPLPPSLRRLEPPPPGERIPYETLLETWRAVGLRSNNPTFGLYVAEHFTNASTFGVVGFLARHSETVGEAFDSVARYAAVIKDEKIMHVEARGGEAVLVAGVSLPSPPCSHFGVESSMASYAKVLRLWTGLPNAAPRRVDFRHAAPADPAIYERFFGCQVNFSQPLDRLVLPAHVLSAPLTTSDPELRSFFRAQADAALGALPPLDDTHARLLRALGEALPRGVPSLGEAARSLGLSARTLQRRLAEQGVSYHDVLDEARRDAALRSLASRRRALREAAEAAGFRDEKAFRRAFRRWTGQAPSAYRASA